MGSPRSAPLRQAENDRAIAQAATCGLNTERKAKLLQIKAESELLEVTLLEGGRGAPPSIAAGAGAAASANGLPGAGLAMGGGQGLEHPAQPSGAESAEPAIAAEDGAGEERLPPRGNFRKCCNVCRGDYVEPHHFYHQLCPQCAEFNLEKR